MACWSENPRLVKCVVIEYAFEENAAYNYMNSNEEYLGFYKPKSSAVSSRSLVQRNYED